MEEWRPYAEGTYEVSSEGRVRRAVGGKGARIGQCLVQSIDSVGYPVVTLCRNGARASIRVHVLVAACFIGLRPDNLHINHIDGIKTNNVPSNLEYITQTENLRHAGRIGLMQSGDNHWSRRRS